MKWYRRAAEQGEADAQSNLGVMYENGRGVPYDNVESAKWYRKAAEQGVADAQFSLGFMHEYGKGVYQSHTEAAKWYRLAAEQGDADAQYSLARNYAEGRGVSENYADALKWFRRAADAHHTKPLQLDRCLDQTLNEHEFPLRHVDSFTTSKYLMEFMLFKPQPLSTCTDS